MPFEPHSLTGRNQLPQTKSIDFEALLRRKIRSSSLVLPAPSAAPLIRLMLLRVFSTTSSEHGSPHSSVHDVDELAFKLTPPLICNALPPAV
jgi:hypothetical protein